MTNEEQIEEMFITAHEYGVDKDIREQIDDVLKSNSKKSFYEIVSDVFYSFVREGKIRY